MTRTAGTAAALEADLRRHHGRYVRGLRVALTDGVLDVNGDAPDFYRKQLVIRDVLASPAAGAARVRVTVRSSAPGEGAIADRAEPSRRRAGKPVSTSVSG